ncbi:MAG: FAD:protein FMN transferase, partial [Acidimicrobiales bacterium]|nr:FAD:protein FMN transferase [Acidimicrobiales bacterium]
HDMPGFLRPTTADIDVDPWLSTITLPPGASFDPGGIGKGAAADAAADALAQHDLHLWLVSLGGDLRLDGPSVALHGWQLTLEHPFERGVQIARLSVGPTAAATSSVAQRRWRRGDLELHHLLDPRTGRPADTDLVAVTVLAGEAWWAEVLAKAAVIAGRTAAHELLDRHGVRAVLFAEDGSCDVVGMPVDDIDWLTDPKEVNRWN